MLFGCRLDVKRETLIEHARQVPGSRFTPSVAIVSRVFSMHRAFLCKSRSQTVLHPWYMGPCRPEATRQKRMTWVTYSG